MDQVTPTLPSLFQLRTTFMEKEVYIDKTQKKEPATSSPSGLSPQLSRMLS
jgi:hypothetical protein